MATVTEVDILLDPAGFGLSGDDEVDEIGSALEFLRLLDSQVQAWFPDAEIQSGAIIPGRMEIVLTYDDGTTERYPNNTRDNDSAYAIFELIQRLYDHAEDWVVYNDTEP